MRQVFFADTWKSGEIFVINNYKKIQDKYMSYIKSYGTDVCHWYIKKNMTNSFHYLI